MKVVPLLPGCLLVILVANGADAQVSNTPPSGAVVQIEPDLLCKGWTRSDEEEEKLNGRVFRPTDSREFPPAKFRNRYVFNKNGTCEWLKMISANQQRMTPARWSVNADDPAVLEIISGSTAKRTSKRKRRVYVMQYRVLELTEDLLRLAPLGGGFR